MSDIWGNVLSGLTEALIGGLFGILLTYLTLRLQDKRKILEYEVFSMPLLRFRPTSAHPIAVSIDKSLLTNDPNDQGSSVYVDTLYGFEIELQNVGNSPIDNCVIEIVLDNNAKIIEFETQPPSRLGKAITVERDDKTPYILRVIPEYINKKERILVRITSTGNKSRKCQVNVLGKDLQSRERSLLRAFLWPMAMLLLVMLILTVMTLSPSSAFAQILIKVFGLRVKQETRIDWPWWVSLGVIMLSFPPYVLMLKETMKNQLRRKGWWGSATFERKTSFWKIFFEWLRG